MRPLGLGEAHRIALRHHGALVVNPVSNRAAVRIPAPSRMYDDGSVEERVRLIRPMGRENMSVRDSGASRWEPSPQTRFATLWERDVHEVPAFSTSGFPVTPGPLLEGHSVVWGQGVPVHIDHGG